MPKPINQEAANAKRKATMAAKSIITRGRTEAGITSAEAESMHTNNGERDPKAKARPSRVRTQGAQKLSTGAYVLDEENYAYRWFADTVENPARVQAAIGAYWEHCADSQGNNIITPSGADISYLMKLEIKYHKEDRELKRKKIKARLAAESRLGEGQHSPLGRNSAITIT